MATRVLARQVANNLHPHLIPAVGSTTQLHTIPVCFDSLVRHAPHDAGNQQTATPAESQHNQSRVTHGKLPQAVAHETKAMRGSPTPGQTLAGSLQGQQSEQQRQVTTDQHPGRGTSREQQQQRRGDTDMQGRQAGPSARSQRWQPPANRSDMQSQGPGAAQRGSSNFRGQPDKGPRPAFIDRSGAADSFNRQPDRGPRPSFIDRSGAADSFRGQPDTGLRPAFIDRSGAADGNRMPNQRARQQAWQANRPGPQSQQNRPAPGNARMPLPEAAPDPDDPDQQAYSESRRRSRVRKVTPSSTRTERPAPGSNLRGGGPAKGSQFFNPAMLGDDIESVSGPNDQEEDTVAENFLERQQYNPRGVPASWKDFIQDIEASHHASPCIQLANHLQGHVLLLAAIRLTVHREHRPPSHCTLHPCSFSSCHEHTLHPQKHFIDAAQLMLFAISCADTGTVPSAQLHVIDCNIQLLQAKAACQVEELGVIAGPRGPG